MPTEKTQEHAAVEKPHSKPGRKPVNSEPKNKRTAQNRAAQRAFRERKERKMKELEDKVTELEKEKVQMATESELLRNQISLLLKQLNRNNIEPGLSVEDSIFNSISVNKNTIPPGEIKLELDDEREHENELEHDNESLNVDTSPDDDKSLNNVSSNLSMSSATPNKIDDDMFAPTLKDLNNSIGIDLDLKNKLNNKSFKDDYDEQIFCTELNSACGSKECIIPKTKLHSSSVLPLTGTNSSMSTPSIVSSTTKSFIGDSLTDSLFDNSLNGENNYISKSISMDDFDRRQSTKNSPFMLNFDSGFNQYSSKNNTLSNNNNSPTAFNFMENNNINGNITNNEMDFLSTNNDTMKAIENNPTAFQFDPNSAMFNNSLVYGLDIDFDNNDDVFDDLLNLPNKNGNLDNIINNSSNDNNSNNDNDDDNEQVPDNTQDLMRCSQIWERITTHPRFTELDIDSLCDELKQKAKCSENGAVVNGSDVGKLLNKAISDHHQENQTKHEVEIKKLALSSNNNGFLQGMW